MWLRWSGSTCLHEAGQKLVAGAVARSYRVRQFAVSGPVVLRRNELLIGPDGLIEDGLLRTRDCEGNSLSTASVDYDVVVPFKNRLLETAWQTSAAGRVRIRSGILISIATNGRAGSTTMRYSGPCRQGTREPITPESPAEGHG